MDDLRHIPRSPLLDTDNKIHSLSGSPKRCTVKNNKNNSLLKTIITIIRVHGLGVSRNPMRI